MPRTLLFHELFPFWRAFFRALDADIVLSRETNPEIVKATQEHAPIETCFPAKLVFGHVRDLLDADADVAFLPSVMTAEDIARGQRHAQICPVIAASSQLVAAHTALAARGFRVLALPLHLWPHRLRRQELDAFAPVLGVGRERVREAAAAAAEEQRQFRAALARAGAAALTLPHEGLPGIVVVGRTYNTCDLGACQDLPLKLRKMGVLPIPMDYLPLDTVDISARYADMYWRSGQRILAAATLVAADPRLHAIYLTNFDCGPDSFLLSYFRRVMGGKPFLELEMDDHTADAGIVTRCEAFLDSLDLRATA
jgi:predicted nucleotide-binding protein (sugar kinase/HSP70/actin superfamily)